MSHNHGIRPTVGPVPDRPDSEGRDGAGSTACSGDTQADQEDIMPPHRAESTLMQSTRRQFSRRMFIQSSGAAFIGAAWPQGGPQPAVKSIDTSVLNIAYVESGNPAGIPIILLHGFP